MVNIRPATSKECPHQWRRVVIVCNKPVMEQPTNPRLGCMPSEGDEQDRRVISVPYVWFSRENDTPFKHQLREFSIGFRIRSE